MRLRCSETSDKEDAVFSEMQGPKEQLQDSSSPPAYDISPLNERLLTPSIEHVDLPESHPEFIDPVEIICCDASGGVYHNLIHGITLRIPEGAVPHGMELKISIGVCLYGNFSFPDGLSPVSAIVWMCTQNSEEFKFLKQVELIVSHFLDCQSVEDAKSLEMCFLKASHQPSATEGFQFRPAEGLMDFSSLADRGILHTQHFCYDCIAAGNNTNDQLKKKKLCITCAVPRPITSWSTIYLYVTYYIPTCIDNLEQLIHNASLYCDEQRMFLFSDVPYILRGKKDVQCSSGKPITVTLQPKVVELKELDFWQLQKDGDLELMIKRKQYPPSMRLKIGELSPTEEQVITVTFEGTQESKEKMAIELTIPSSTGPSSAGNGQCTPQANTVLSLRDTPTIRQLTLLKTEFKDFRIIQDLAKQWKDVGIMIDWDHVYLLDDTEFRREGPESCCRRILIDWLKGRGKYQPPTWANLIQILKDMHLLNLVMELDNYLSN